MTSPSEGRSAAHVGEEVRLLPDNELAQLQVARAAWSGVVIGAPGARRVVSVRAHEPEATLSREIEDLW